MLESSVERTVILTAIVLWFAHGWYLNERLKHLHTKLDRVLETFDGLRDYLYEIDPQFDDERESRHAFEDNETMFAGISDMELVRKKEQEGRRTLNTPLVR
ncbi:MAG: hypothetical protein HS112_06270 [Zoogloeaceae bacterium]|nr:hypothetical protein [Zoogloeaceae bacterium]